MRYEETRKIVLEAIMEAVEQKLINGTSGNIAMRTPEDPNVVCITPSGIPYTGMKPEDIAVVVMKEDGTNEWIDGKYKPSSEVPMHCAVMRARKDVNATVHTHSMYATICAMGENPQLVPITPPQCEFTPVGIVSFCVAWGAASTCSPASLNILSTRNSNGMPLGGRISRVSPAKKRFR